MDHETLLDTLSARLEQYASELRWNQLRLKVASDIANERQKPFWQGQDLELIENGEYLLNQVTLTDFEESLHHLQGALPFDWLAEILPFIFRLEFSELQTAIFNSRLLEIVFGRQSEIDTSTTEIPELRSLRVLTEELRGTHLKVLRCLSSEFREWLRAFVDQMIELHPEESRFKEAHTRLQESGV